MIPIILGVAIIVFVLMSFTPGDPAQIILGATATQAQLDVMRDAMGLNDPYFVQLGRFLSDTFIRFELGASWITQADIMDSIIERLPRTFGLAIATLALSLLIGVPLGIFAAVKQGRLGDNICMAIALVGLAIPDFWLALLLILLFSVHLAWLPAMGLGGIEFFILPALAGCSTGIAIFARQTRSSMLDVIRSDYITTARAKGVPEFNVITRHALKNALIPIITITGTRFGNMLGGTMIIETIFAMPGIGLLIITALNNRDYPVVQAGSIFLAIAFAFSMLLVDLLYAVVDPRIKGQYVRQRRRVKKNA